MGEYVYFPESALICTQFAPGIQISTEIVKPLAKTCKD